MELDIVAAISQGILNETQLFEVRVAALNVVRSIFEENNLFASVDFFEKYNFVDAFSTLLEVNSCLSCEIFIIVIFIKNFMHFFTVHRRFVCI